MLNPAQVGTLIMALAAFGFSCGDVVIKVLGENLSPWQISAGRGLCGVLAALVFMRFNYRQLLFPQWPWQFLMGLANAIGYTAFIFALRFLPLSIALPLCFAYPAMGALMSPFINNEKPSRSDWIAIGMAFGAVICLSMGASSNESVSLMGIAIGLGGAFWVALMANLARRFNQAPLSANVFYLFFGNLILGAPLVLIFDGPVLPAPVDMVILFVYIIPVTLVAFTLMFVGYRYVSAPRGGIILTLEAALVSAYGFLVLNEPLTMFVGIGFILMLSSCIIIVKAKAT